MASLTIKNHVFEISAPYTAGHIALTEGEAHALNQTRKENIGNIVRPIVDKGELTPEELQAYVKGLDESYAFGTGGGSRGPRLIGLPKYIKDVGDAMFKLWVGGKGAAQFRAKGLKMPTVKDKDAFDKLRTRFLEARASDIESEAKARFEADTALLGEDDLDLT